ncbi:hypothetical protein M3J09_005240 [Ascochyta lentis]
MTGPDASTVCTHRYVLNSHSSIDDVSCLTAQETASSMVLSIIDVYRPVLVESRERRTDLHRHNHARTHTHSAPPDGLDGMIGA